MLLTPQNIIIISQIIKVLRSLKKKKNFQLWQSDTTLYSEILMFVEEGKKPQNY